MSDRMDRPSRLGLPDGQPTQPKIPGIEKMVNHTQCLSDGLDNIYI